MRYKFQILILLLAASGVKAQVAITPVKATDKPSAEIDYKNPGAPMPVLRYLVYHDTTAKVASAVPETGDLKSAKAGNSRKKKKHHETTQGDNNDILSNKDFDNGANLFVMMFNPTCSHCQQETRMLEKNSSLFKRSKVLLIATPMMGQYMNEFVKATHANEYPFMQMGIDSSGFVNNVFLYRALPQINIYDRDRKLIKLFSGEVAIDSLKNYIE